MANRAGAMATIDTAIQQAHAGPNQGKVITGPAPDLTQPPPALGGSPAAAPPLTPDQKKQAAEQAKIRKHQEALLGKEQAEALEEARRKQVEREKSLLGIGDKILEKAGEGKETAQVKIASVPTPGDIWFPLILLILFFFILILYNGHTRIQWLWLVLTGNASVSGVSSTGGVPGFDVTRANQLLSDTGGVPGVDVNAANQQLSGNGVYGDGY